MAALTYQELGKAYCIKGDNYELVYTYAQVPFKQFECVSIFYPSTGPLRSDLDFHPVGLGWMGPRPYTLVVKLSL